MSKTKNDQAKKWVSGSAAEFLELTPEEAAYIDLKIKLADKIVQTRKQKKLTQVKLAALIKSSQSRVAKMESGHPSVSLDLMVKTLLALGVNQNQLAKVIGSPPQPLAS